MIITVAIRLMQVAAVFLICNAAFCQESLVKRFGKLSCAEKRWVIFHPFTAKKAWQISSEAIDAAKQMEQDTTLDRDPAGGQVDAFRHAYWMARLVQEMHWRKVLKLGKAHEKGNKRQFKKGQSEDGALPDYISCQMDFLNNDTGIQIGKENRDAGSGELKNIIISLIREGKLFIIKKDTQGNYLDKDGAIIQNIDYQRKWYNPRCLVPSNYKK